LKEKYLLLIDKQINKLDAEDFDLEAWKSSAAYILKMIFGADDSKIKEIESLKIDYSSWALRDASSTYRPEEMCKKKGREIMEIAKDELDLNGVKSKDAELMVRLKEQLTEQQFEKLTKSEEDRRAVLKSLNKDQLIKLLMPLIKH